MSIMSPSVQSIFKFKHPSLLGYDPDRENIKVERFNLKLERAPANVKNAPYVQEHLVALLNRLETRGEVIKQVVMTDWSLSCRMPDDIVGVLAKGTDRIDLEHYVWYGRADVWQADLQLDDLVGELHRRHGTAIKPQYLIEKFLQLECTVEIVILNP